MYGVKTVIGTCQVPTAKVVRRKFGLRQDGIMSENSGIDGRTRIVIIQRHPVQARKGTIQGGTENHLLPVEMIEATTTDLERKGGTTTAHAAHHGHGQDLVLVRQVQVAHFEPADHLLLLLRLGLSQLVELINLQKVNMSEKQMRIERIFVEDQDQGLALHLHHLVEQSAETTVVEITLLRRGLECHLLRRVRTRSQENQAAMIHLDQLDYLGKHNSRSKTCGLHLEHFHLDLQIICSIRIIINHHLINSNSRLFRNISTMGSRINRRISNNKINFTNNIKILLDTSIHLIINNNLSSISSRTNSISKARRYLPGRPSRLRAEITDIIILCLLVFTMVLLRQRLLLFHIPHKTLIPGPILSPLENSNILLQTTTHVLMITILLAAIPTHLRRVSNRHFRIRIKHFHIPQDNSLSHLVNSLRHPLTYNLSPRTCLILRSSCLVGHPI